MEKFYVAPLGWYYRPADVDRRIKEFEAELKDEEKMRKNIANELFKTVAERDRLRAENQRMADIAGEALSTQPEQRGPETVEVLVNHAKRLSEEIVMLRDALRLAGDEPNIDRARAIADKALGGGE
jgi:septal ring factor EnvC (AmiA/AmiB activator)